MNSTIINRKQIMNINGEDIVDLTSASLQYVNDDPVIMDQFYVGEDMVMRPDSLSYVAYGTTDYFDLIMKFNGISNPFAIDKTDYILAPDIQFMFDSMPNPQVTANNTDITQQYINPTKGQTIDPKKVEYDEAIKNLRKTNTNINFSKFPLPPNLAQPGDKEATITKDGTVILGDSITKNK
jgi:hypothetical protein